MIPAKLSLLKPDLVTTVENSLECSLKVCTGFHYIQIEESCHWVFHLIATGWKEKSTFSPLEVFLLCLAVMYVVDMPSYCTSIRQLQQHYNV